MPAPLEKDIQKACLDWLRANGALAIRVNSGAMKGQHNGKKWFMKFNDTPGCSDIICLWPHKWAGSEFIGVFVAIEVKRPGEKMTPLQESFAAEVKKRDGVHLCVSSLDELIAMLA